jgi:hypothetical protein
MMEHLAIILCSLAAAQLCAAICVGACALVWRALR